MEGRTTYKSGNHLILECDNLAIFTYVKVGLPSGRL